MDNSHQEKRLLLHRLIQIVKFLDPSTRTVNPFQLDISEASRHLDIEDRILFHELLHSITILNQKGRVNEEGQLISSQTDWLNALELILPKELRLNVRSMKTYEKLHDIYGETSFTYIQACSRLKISMKTLQRQMKPLLAHGLLLKIEAGDGSKNLLQIVAFSDLLAEDKSQELFEEMQGDWKDFRGFEGF